MKPAVLGGIIVVLVGLWVVWNRRAIFRKPGQQQHRHHENKRNWMHKEPGSHSSDSNQHPSSTDQVSRSKSLAQIQKHTRFAQIYAMQHLKTVVDELADGEFLDRLLKLRREEACSLLLEGFELSRVVIAKQHRNAQARQEPYRFTKLNSGSLDHGLKEQEAKLKKSTVAASKDRSTSSTGSSAKKSSLKSAKDAKENGKEVKRQVEAKNAATAAGSTLKTVKDSSSSTLSNEPNVSTSAAQSRDSEDATSPFSSAAVEIALLCHDPFRVPHLGEAVKVVQSKTSPQDKYLIEILM